VTNPAPAEISPITVARRGGDGERSGGVAEWRSGGSPRFAALIVGVDRWEARTPHAERGGTQEGSVSGWGL
jgi:hypothetical protein